MEIGGEKRGVEKKREGNGGYRGLGGKEEGWKIVRVVDFLVYRVVGREKRGEEKV
jgi:hypothetical protein